MRKSPRRPIAGKPHSSFEVSQKALDTPERIVDYCRDKGFVNGVEVDIEALINDNDELRLVKKDLGSIDAYIKQISPNLFEIGVNMNHSRSRQRFSMAHEYAHYQLHREQIKDMPEGEQILHRSEEKNPVEHQANNLAANVLMPEQAFREQVSALDGDVGALAKEFSVSQIAVRYRAKNLGMRGHGV